MVVADAQGKRPLSQVHNRSIVIIQTSEAGIEPTGYLLEITLKSRVRRDFRFP
ncbi:hypothetical protein [Sphingobium sp. WCS2017Hpa-17]|uniref:hypothetical protein n=1 Tax=Sphingobium sp. WCS2017Hpa-17 TaxID=3073638 RepID=UPI00288BC2A9|nr:hypothetical protein [Sphingobium sp. WCS2017Hpa-17]